ncbi:MAG: NADH:flavin oxidoreductase/NADH oxidase [Pseudomonas sp.]|nr:NADH:flavin oxidoreductase/NADH oxidase [Pseudomonas sp.]
MTHRLFDTYSIGDIAVKNRVVMASMTRGRAANAGLVPGPMMVEYYRQRASAGLIISEGTWVNPESIGHLNVPGIWSDEQVEGWRAVTAAVHEAGGKIFNQLGHLGSVSHPDHLNGELPLAPSAINPQEQSYTPDGFKDTPTPREMTLDDIHRTVAAFRKAGENAKAAGFDGVEIHGAYLYLFQQFLSTDLNHRTDEYGGSVENRSRFLFDVVEALVDVWGPGRVALKIGPATTSGPLIRPNADAVSTFAYVAQKLNDYPLAYLHLWGPGEHEALPGTPGEIFKDIAGFFRPLFKGVLIASGGYSLASAKDAISAGQLDLVAFAAPFVANPDLVERFKRGAELATPDVNTFYAGSEQGYCDYPTLAG